MMLKVCTLETLKVNICMEERGTSFELFSTIESEEQKES